MIDQLIRIAAEKCLFHLRVIGLVKVWRLKLFTRVQGMKFTTNFGDFEIHRKRTRLL